MSNGTNWMGGRGHVKKAKSGLKILERGGNLEQHFAKLRAITCNLIAKDLPNRDTNSNITSTVCFKHAQSDSQGSVLVHAAVGTEDDLTHLRTSVLPRVLERPNKFTKQNRLPELMKTAVRNIESLDSKRAHITSIDAKSLAGLDITSRKRKYGGSPDVQDQFTSKPFYYPYQVEPRAFAASPSPEPPIVVDTCADHVEDMLSFGTPSDRQSMDGTQVSTSLSNRQTQDERMSGRGEPIAGALSVSTTPTGSQSNIPPNLYEDAFRIAAQTLKLQDALLGVQTNISLAPWHARPSEDDSEVRVFNLFTPVQVNVPDGIHVGPEPRAETPLQEERDPLNKLSGALDKEDRPDIGNPTWSSLGQDRQDQPEDKAVYGPARFYAKPGMETPQGTKPPLLPKKPTGKAQNNLGRGSVPPSPLDRYVHRSHSSHSWRTSDQVALSSRHTNNHKEAEYRALMMITESAPRLDSPRPALDFPSVESSPSPSQEMGVSLTTGSDNNRVIALPLFDDHS